VKGLCEAQMKRFSVQQFFKNAAEVWASSPHLRSKLNCIMKENKNQRENCDSQGKAGDVPQPCRTLHEEFSQKSNSDPISP
jgi:hypothetical protein